ncbi:MAG: FAD-dependent oxidoreductase [Phycisphaerales bacterium]|nr:FAD-dependent oxidoreductase [Phycisphaerales bacterium]
MDRRSFIAGGFTGLAYSVLIDGRRVLARTPLDTPPAGTLPRLGGVPAFEPAATPLGAEPNMTLVDVETDVLVCGGGMAGVCAALAAARNGARVLLVQDRSRLGGNASSEIKMHIVGADCHGSRPGWRESGIIEEIRLEDAARNPHRAYELFDLLLYDKCISEPNLTLLLDSAVFCAEVEDGRITTAFVRCDKTEHLYRVRAHVYLDCTGDSRLALEAGADMRWGREGRSEFGETLAPETGDRTTQGSSILFTARKHDQPVPYVAPGWARDITAEDLRLRNVGRHSYEYGFWWIELGGIYDTIRDNERLRFELLAIVLGVWNYIKNSGDRPDSANWALETVGMIPGKRESRRIMGDHIQTEHDLNGGWKRRDDGVAIGGWSFDEHPPEGFDAPQLRPYRAVRMDEPYNIAFESLYARNVENLMMAGRNISNSHVAFTSTRVMATCSCIGQAVGTAAAMCIETGMTPRALRRERIGDLQQRLLRDDQPIRQVVNEDPADLARHARVSASSVHEGGEPAHVIDGQPRDMPGSSAHRWRAKPAAGAWIELRWPTPQRLQHIQITFDSGFHRELTLSASDGVTRRTVRGPQPETVRDYRLIGVRPDGERVTLAEETGNFQRLRRHRFAPLELEAVRIEVVATNGSEEARVYEVRAYG